MPTRQVVVTFEQIVQRLDVMWLSPGDFTKQMYGNQLTHAVNTHYEDLAQQLGCSIEDISWWFGSDVSRREFEREFESPRVRTLVPRGRRNWCVAQCCCACGVPPVSSCSGVTESEP